MENEITIRLGFFFGILFLIIVWEILAPRRPLTTSKVLRWTSNFGIVILNSLILRLLFPIVAVGMAILSQERGWGLFNSIEVPYELSVVLSVVILDLIIYFQHVMFHKIPILWRLHRMHHADLDFDVTTGARFHPIEIILSMGIKLAVVVILGPPALAILIFEVLLSTTAMFNHGNIQLPEKVDRILRWFLVTPDMHRVHHSVIPEETNSNYCFSQPWWDRLFGTYREQPQKGHESMTIGIESFREPKYLHLPWLLIQPFLNTKSSEVSPSSYSTNQQEVGNEN